MAAPASARFRPFFGFVVIRRAACTYLPLSMNLRFGFGLVRAKLNGMPFPQLSNASRWQQPNPSLKRPYLWHAA